MEGDDEGPPTHSFTAAQLPTLATGNVSLDLKDLNVVQITSGQLTVVVPLQSSGRMVPNAKHLTAHRVLGKKTRALLSTPKQINTQAGKEKRQELVESILSKSQADSRLQDEIYEQLVNSTKRNTHLVDRKNAWNLLKEVSQRIPCSSSLKFVQKRAKAVADQREEDPQIRLLACHVTDALEKSDNGELTVPYKSTVDKHSLDLHTLDIFFSDGSIQEVIFDQNMSIRDVTSQVSWTVGIEKPAEYALYDDREDCTLILNQNRALAAVLLDDFSPNAGIQRVLFDKVLSRVTEEEKLDEEEASRSFFRLNEQYREGDFHVSDSVKVQLCVFHIQAYHHPPDDGDFNSLSAVVSKWMKPCFPESGFEKRCHVDWRTDVVRCFRRLGHLPPKEAHLNFLQVLRSLQCSNCFECLVKTGDKFPLEDMRRTELKLVVCCSSLLFFEKESDNCVLAINIGSIKSLEMNNEGIFLTGRIRKTSSCFWLETESGTKICEVLNWHQSVILHRINHSCSQDNIWAAQKKETSISQALPEKAHTGQTLDMGSEAKLLSSSAGRGASSSQMTGTSRQSWARESGSRPAANEDYQRLDHALPDSTKGPPAKSEDTSSHHTDKLSTKIGAFDEDYTPLMDKVDELTENCIFARKYKIQRRPANAKQKIVYAQNKYNSKDMVLKFYASRALFENCCETYKKIGRSEYICEMEEDFHEDGYPPCIAFERGDVTLEEWLFRERNPLEIKDVLLQVLLALIELHRRKLVHCDLKPSNIMFFPSAHKWKLLDLDSTVVAGVPSAVYTTLRYAAPEIVRTINRGAEKTVVETSADMWSFGIMLFEVMTGNTFYGPKENDQKIKELLCADHELIDEMSLECVDEDQVASLIKKVVRMNPRERRTAKRSSEHAMFKSGVTTSQRAGIETFTRKLDMVLELTQLSLEQLTAANLMTAIQVECPRSGPDSNNLLNEGECGEAVFAFSDDFLPDNPVFVMKIGELHCLRIIFVHERMVQVPIRRVVSVKARLPDKRGDAAAGEAVIEELEIEQVLVDPMKCEAIAFINPVALNYQRLLTLSPMIGGVDEKYVCLELLITVSVSDDETQTFDLKHKIYCQIVSPDHRSNMQKFSRQYNKQWESVPQWARDFARASVFLAKLGMRTP